MKSWVCFVDVHINITIRFIIQHVIFCDNALGDIFAILLWINTFEMCRNIVPKWLAKICWALFCISLHFNNSKYKIIYIKYLFIYSLCFTLNKIFNHYSVNILCRFYLHCLVVYKVLPFLKDSTYLCWHKAIRDRTHDLLLTGRTLYYWATAAI